MPKNELGFYILQYEKPPLRDDNLFIKATQTVSIGGNVAATYTCDTAVNVSGPQYYLPPQEIVSVYPAPGGTVHHRVENTGNKVVTSFVLPQVILTRSTLPWERSPVEHPSSEQTQPWMALLVFDQDDADQIKPVIPDQKEDQNKPVNSELKQGALDGIYQVRKGWIPDTTFFAPSLPPNSGLPVSMQLLKLSSTKVQKYLPAWNDWPLLAQVRQPADKTRPSQAVVIASPAILTQHFAEKSPRKSRRMTACLVSLEKWYKNGSILPLNGGSALLVVLKMWTYLSVEDEGTSVEALLKSLTEPRDGNQELKKPLRVPAQRADDSEFYLSAGFTVLPHLKRSGGLNMSFYHGPLVPWTDKDKVVDAASIDRPTVTKHPKVGMDDVSYIAAWELGRLLMLHDRRASRELSNWKTRQLQRNQQDGKDVAHLPANGKDLLVEFPKDWFQRLASLEGVPFEYLVPDERMLPRKPGEETIRFFWVDRAWIQALLCGAYSVGPHYPDLAQVKQTPVPYQRGFLLRSSIVSDFPELRFVLTPADKDHITRRLSKDVELHLYPAEVTEITIGLPPETLHFEWSTGDPWPLKGKGLGSDHLYSGFRLTFSYLPNTG